MHRKNFALALCLCVTLAFAGLIYSVSKSVIIGGMHDIEIQIARDKMLQLHSYIHALEMQISLLAVDWSCWNEAFEYVQGRNDSFVRDNISVDSLRKLSITSAAIFQNTNTLLHFVDANNFLPDPDFIVQEISIFNEIVRIMKIGNTDKIDGFIIIQGKPQLVSAHRIYDSEKKRTSDGLIILTTNFDEEYVNRIQHMEKYEFSILPSRSFLNLDLERVPNSDFKMHKTEDEIAMYSMISDIFGMSAFCLELKEKRSIAHVAKLMSWRNFSLLLCFGLIIVAAGFLLLHAAEIRFMRREVAFKTGHDSLTGLVNKNLLPERLAQELIRIRKKGLLMAVIYIDLNRFKIVNDSYGHEQGDALLREAARRLRGISGNDLVARAGGDKFLLATGAEDRDEIGEIAEIVLDLMHKPFILNDNEVHVGASLGVSIAPFDGEDARLLIHRAELAMHHARGLKEDDYSFFIKDMEVAVTHKMELESALYLALENNALTVYYQPKVNIAMRDVAGCEALVRWRHKDGSFTPPPVFIPVAEECGLITDVDMFVLRSACRQVREWNSQGCAVPVAVNMSVHSILSDGFAEQVLKILHDEQVPFSLIDLEITESCLMNNMEKALAAITELTRKGIHIALDDFGTGYSSLQYLSAMPISCLKIDKKFVDDIYSGKAAAQSLVKSILALAANLGMSTVSEGVEDHRQLDFLVANGASVIQGYLFSKPLDAASCGDFLRNRYARISSVIDAAAESA